MHLQGLSGLEAVGSGATPIASGAPQKGPLLTGGQGGHQRRHAEVLGPPEGEAIACRDEVVSSAHPIFGARPETISRVERAAVCNPLHGVRKNLPNTLGLLRLATMSSGPTQWHAICAVTCVVNRPLDPFWYLQTRVAFVISDELPSVRCATTDPQATSLCSTNIGDLANQWDRSVALSEIDRSHSSVTLKKMRPPLNGQQSGACLALNTDRTPGEPWPTTISKSPRLFDKHCLKTRGHRCASCRIGWESNGIRFGEHS